MDIARRRQIARPWRRLAVLALSLLLPAAAGAQARLQGGVLPVPEEGYELIVRGDLTVEHLADEGVAGRLIRLFAECRQEVEGRLGLKLPPRPHVVIAPSDREFSRRYGLLAGRTPPGHVLAVAFAQRNLVIIRRSGLQEGTDSGLERTFQHELTHLALAGLERRRGKRLPRWLNEGLSEWAAGRRPTWGEATTLANWAERDQIPPFVSLAESFPPHGGAAGRAYTISMAFLCWVDDRGGARDLVAALETTPSVDEAFRRVVGVDAASAETLWKMELAEEQSVWWGLVLSLNVWTVTALIALLAIARHVWVTRRKKRELLRQDMAEDGLL